MEAIAELKSQLENQTDYVFNTDKLTFSAGLKGDEQSYVTGYISTSGVDIYNDLVTPAGLKSMLRQIQESPICLDYEHEAWRDDNTILPVGRIVEAKVDDRGLWVKCMLNKNSPKYKALWGSIKDGFINSFSIAFKPIRTIEKMIGKAKVKLIEELELLNVALTGNPVNKDAVVTGHSMKSVMLKAIEDTKDEKVLISKLLVTKFLEEKQMETKDEEKIVEEAAPEAEATPEVEAVVEEKVEETVEEPKAEAVVEETVEVKDMIAELKSLVEKQAKDNAALKLDLKTLKESPVFKSTMSQPALAEKPKLKGMVSLIQ